MKMLGLNEALIAAAVEKLRVGLPVAIAQLNAEAGAPVQLNPDVELLDFVPTPSELIRFPTVGIQEDSGTLEDDIGSGATGAYGLVAVTFCQNADQQTLARELRRYRRAVASVLMEDRLIGDVAWGVTATGFLPGPTLGRSEGPATWVSYNGVGIMCKVEEDG